VLNTVASAAERQILALPPVHPYIANRDWETSVT